MEKSILEDTLQLALHKEESQKTANQKDRVEEEMEQSWSPRVSPWSIPTSRYVILMLLG